MRYTDCHVSHIRLVVAAVAAVEAVVLVVAHLMIARSRDLTTDHTDGSECSDGPG